VVLPPTGGSGQLLNSERFDLVCLDEASQATEPLSWIPILLAEKVVMAGDPLQLPPTIHSKEAADRGLKITLMERLQPHLPDESSNAFACSIPHERRDHGIFLGPVLRE
jgi:ATP-dependent RNA/DNA helicase IGHMBP2